MLLSSRVIKQVNYDMEKWPVQAKINFDRPQNQGGEEEIDIYPDNTNEEAQLIMENARKEAAAMMAEAGERVRQIEQEAFHQGFTKGEEEARQAHKQDQESFRESTLQVLHEVNQLHQKIYQNTEVEILALSIDIAEKLVCSQLELKPETIIDIARAACIQAKECEMVIIYAAPDQIETLRSRHNEFSTQLYRNKRLEFIADPTIKNGGCRIETEQGYIDATVETMLKQLNTIIKDKS
jgi:Flagellar biosynthesis/type III secretory pathway protein